MNLKRILIIIITIISWNTLVFAQADSIADMPSTDTFTDIFLRMEKTVKSIKTVSFRFVKNERVEGEIMKSDQLCKQVVSPLSIYMKLEEGPYSGSEVLYVQGKNDGDAYVNASAYLPTLSLDPYGSFMKRGQRHTIFQLGFKYTFSIIEHVYHRYKNREKEKERFITSYTYGGITTWEGRKVHQITLNNPEYKILDYTVLEREDILKIARNKHLDEYNILELNPSIDNYTDVKAGQVIKIPSSFSKKTIMFIDAETFLVVYQKVFDWNGLVGEYEYLDIAINPTFKTDEFSKEFSGYGF